MLRVLYSTVLKEFTQKKPAIPAETLWYSVYKRTLWKTWKLSLLTCYPMCKHSTIWSLQGWKIIEPMICHRIDGTPLVIVDCHSMVWSRSITTLELPPSLFMQFVKKNNHEDSLSFSNLQRNIDRMKRLRLSGFFVHHSFVLIELVSGKHVFHEGVFSKPSNNWPDTVSCSMKLDRAAHGTLAFFTNLESCAKRVIFWRENDADDNYHRRQVFDPENE